VLARQALAVEAAGFDMIATDDHFHPWKENQGHAGFAWITLGIIAQQTQRLHLCTTVTCPTYRYRPAMVAQTFATLSLFAPGRVFLGVGLVEALEIIRGLWTGEWMDFQGQYYQIKHARLYDAPAQPIPIYLAGEGPKSARLAGA
jgi:alkanesulfonate monooxygenase SsuD/methylene tetrahydromethanopterin reductase-like flavin-dependent oxidoreductase (luciferase family)